MRKKGFVKKVVSLALTAVMGAGLLAGCGGTTTTTTTSGSTTSTAEAASGKTAAATDDSDVSGANVFVFKASGIKFGDLLYEGFKTYMESQGEKTAFKSPAETTVSAQVQLLDELITQGAKSITISCDGETGYDQVFKKAQEKGIPIVSVDGKASPDWRTTHVTQASTESIGRAQVQLATLIALKKDYPEDGDLEKAVQDALADYSGDPIKIGVLSGAVDSPVQNGWIDYMKDELKKDMYSGKVDPELDIKYGNDDLTESTTQANAFLAEGKIDVMVAPTTVGISAAGQVLKSANSDLKVTGIGIPSEMASFMPTGPDDNAFDYVCPYMVMWNLLHMGAVSAATTISALNGMKGEVGDKVEMAAYDDTYEPEFPATTYTVEEMEDGGTQVIQGDPMFFYKGNIADWVNVM